jgi:hypothetical protein
MEKAAIEIWLPEFLKRAAEIANGDYNVFNYPFPDSNS